MRSGTKVLASLVLVAIFLFLSGCEVVRVFFPSSDHDEVAPELPASLSRPAVLVFSKTNGFRHGEAIEAGIPAFEAMAEKRGWSLFSTENGAVHNARDLARFDAVVWFNVSGDVLADDQRQALLDWVQAGGGFFGIHGTGGDPNYAWEAHPEVLVGAQFVGHPMGPQFQEATMRIEAPDHPAMQHLDETWTRTEEWYSFEKSPRGPDVQVLATVDESTYSHRSRSSNG
jgi:type 1 glutamine amidotransferase